MDLKATLQSDLKDAMRHGEETRKNTVRMALAAIKLSEVKKGDQLDEAESLAVIQKEIKVRYEVIADAERAHRPELVAQAEQEIKVLQGYLKILQRYLHLLEDLSQEEVEALAKTVISEVGATSIGDMGQVMKALIPRLQGRASGDQAKLVVRKLLQ